MDFIQDGPDAGKVLLTEAGATKTNNLGRDLLLIDPVSGSHQQIYQFSTTTPVSTITGVQRDPYGRFLVSDYGPTSGTGPGKIWLLTPPLPRPNLGTAVSGGNLKLSWPLTGVTYQLQESSDLGSPNSWHASPAIIQINTNGIETQIPATNTVRFYRLKKNS